MHEQGSTDVAARPRSLQNLRRERTDHGLESSDRALVHGNSLALDWGQGRAARQTEVRQNGENQGAEGYLDTGVGEQATEDGKDSVHVGEAVT